jgi:hypothetical protein
MICDPFFYTNVYNGLHEKKKLTDIHTNGLVTKDTVRVPVPELFSGGWHKSKSGGGVSGIITFCQALT